MTLSLDFDYTDIRISEINVLLVSPTQLSINLDLIYAYRNMNIIGIKK